MKLIPLGVAGWIPSNRRSTSAFLLEVENELIILDAGTGLGKLGKYQAILDKYDHLHIILSHYHLDHIIGLSYLSKWFKNKEVTIWGPGEKYYGETCEEILMRFASPPYFSKRIKDFARKVTLRDYDESGFSLGRLPIGVILQDHTNPSFGISIGKYLHYATDTTIIPESFKTGCELVLHECWSLKEEEAFGHTSLEALEAAAITSEQKIGLIHLNPKFTEEELKDFEGEYTFVVKEDQAIYGGKDNEEY